MAFNNRRGGYANRNSGGNRGGSFGGRGNNRGNSRGGNRGGNGGGNYLRSSTFVKNLIDEDSKEREQVFMEPGVTEEIAFTLTAAKVQDLKDMIEDAENDPEGDGGLRITMYCSNKVNEDTGEEFDGANILIVGKFPPKDKGNKRGGSFKNRGGSAGRNTGRNQRNNQDDDQRDSGGDGQEAEAAGDRPSRNTRGGKRAAKKTDDGGGEESHSAKDDGGSYSEEPGW